MGPEPYRKSTPKVQSWGSGRGSDSTALGLGKVLQKCSAGPHLYTPAEIILMRAGLPLHFSGTFRCILLLTNTFSQYILTYSVIFDDSLFGEVNRDLIVKANYSTTDVLLDMILIRNKIRNKCKEPIIDLHKKMRGRVPSQKKIEQDIFEMLQNAKEENARHSPVVRVYKKAGPNELCPCGSGRKFKKCCIGKGIYD